MKIVTNLIFASFCLISFSQNNTSKKLTYHSFSISPIEIYFDENTGGASISSDFSLSSNRNIYSISMVYSEGISIFTRANRYFQLNALYGREHKIVRWFYIDTHAGLGLFNIKDNHTSQGTLGIPIQVKLRFKTGPKFSLGFRLQSNLNSLRFIHTAGFVLQWNSAM